MYDEIYQPTYGVQAKLHVHRREDCRGRFCVIHNPQPGPWRDWPTNWRGDRKLMERVCPHGVGHPAAEDAAWLSEGALHGCDGCPCSPILEGEWREEDGPL